MASTRPIDEPWYAEMAARYGEDYCFRAGYFEEENEMVGKYADHFNLPSQRIVFVFSGAFHPFHKGHSAALYRAIIETFSSDIFLGVIHAVVHVDHVGYRSAKGHYPEALCDEALTALKDFPFPVTVVREDLMPLACSRNFIRLYTELEARNVAVWFVAGGDRANYALSFRDRGACVVSGRDSHEMFQRYRHLAEVQPKRFRFISGDHPASSTAIRRGHVSD